MTKSTYSNSYMIDAAAQAYSMTEALDVLMAVIDEYHRDPRQGIPHRNWHGFTFARQVHAQAVRSFLIKRDSSCGNP